MVSEDEICWCNSCRRIGAPFKAEWTGRCSCKGADMACFVDPDNWSVSCADCGAPCTGDIVLKMDGQPGYGHVTWTCNWAPCSWWWC